MELFECTGTNWQVRCKKKLMGDKKLKQFFANIWQIWSKNSPSCRKMSEEKKNSEKNNKKLIKDDERLIK